MSPNRWGPPIWTFFHVLAEKINEEKFHSIFPILFDFIRRICRILPCPECSEHATTFLSKVNPAGVRNKNDFRNIMWIFHNIVNRRKQKPVFDGAKLTERYGGIGPIVAYNGFVGAFQTKGNMKLLADTFQRKLVLADFRKWFLTNIRFFLPRPTIQQPVEEPVSVETVEVVDAVEPDQGCLGCGN
jgi:hypothetical protein